jgi:hypothetical protein
MKLNSHSMQYLQLEPCPESSFQRWCLQRRFVIEPSKPTFCLMFSSALEKVVLSVRKLARLVK